MRFFFVLFLGISGCCQLYSSDTIITHVFVDNVETKLRFTDSLEVFIDEEAQYDIEDILYSPTLKFEPFPEGQELQAPVVIWTKIQLTNAGTKKRDGYFGLLTFTDSIWMYTVKDGVLLDETLTGMAFKPSEKSLVSKLNDLPISLYAGETKTYYFKLRYDKLRISGKALSWLRYFPSKPLIEKKIVNYSLQSFYAGLMLLFGLVSIFMFFLFRERVFIYFSVLMFTFTAYFLMLYNLTDLLLDRRSIGLARVDLQFAITFILISFTLFVSRFIDLRERHPKIYIAYISYSLFAAFFSHFARLSTDNWVWVTITNNKVIIPWILLTMILTIWAARKKDKPSLMLLLSMGILFLGSLLFTLSLLGIVPSNLWTQYAFQIGTVLFSGTLFYGLFDKINTIKSEKQRFEELDQIKSRFFVNISHEFRTPLTLVMGPLQQLKEKASDPKDRNLLIMAHRNAGRLLQLINQLLDLSKLEAGKMELKTEELNFALLLKGIIMSFESLATRKNIRLHFVTQKEAIPLFVDKDKVEKIFYNLLSNAFKFTKENGEVAVMVTDQEKYIEVLVRDNGRGISSKRLPHIFNRFFQSGNSEPKEQEGTGIGLALVKEFVQLHDGTIRVESKVGKGTSFIIIFPKGSAHLKEAEILPKSSTQNKLEDFIPIDYIEPEEEVLSGGVPSKSVAEALIENEKPIVLIIEDHTDVRAYIKQHLVESFQILEAVNGQDGIEKAFNHLPDLIISDVMMPKKDGYEVCTILKTDQRTSHIPVILLTAKADTEEKLKGLEIGADDYLVKPFDTRELEVRVRKLIELRLQLRKRFFEAKTIEPQSAGTNAIDRTFLEKVCSIVEFHLSNEQFSVDVLAQEVGMSKGHLNRKLRALVDQSANKFIQSYRLQKAREMLLQKTGNVSEIAMKTGFRSTAYFIKCFGDKYGETPGSLFSK